MSTKHGWTGIRWAVVVATAALLAGSTPDVQARDRGFNQPGAAGNAAVGVGGSARQTRAVADPGFNQPGAIGNVGVGGAGRGVDPGLNQPGAAGNVGRDPGLNQPGPQETAGNREEALVKSIA